ASLLQDVFCVRPIACEPTRKRKRVLKMGQDNTVKPGPIIIAAQWIPPRTAIREFPRPRLGLLGCQTVDRADRTGAALQPVARPGEGLLASMTANFNEVVGAVFSRGERSAGSTCLVKPATVVTRHSRTPERNRPSDDQPNASSCRRPSLA